MADGSPNAYALSSSFLIILLLPQSCTRPLRGCARGEVNQPMAHCGYPPLQTEQVKVKLQRPPTDLGSSLGLGLGLGFGLMNDIVPFRPRAYAIIRHISTGYDMRMWQICYLYSSVPAFYFSSHFSMSIRIKNHTSSQLTMH